MSREFTDSTGVPVTVEIIGDGPVRSYAVFVTEGTTPVGRADFVDPESSERERIFFHTEVDPEFGGRGLAGILVRTALADAVDDGLTVVPICRLFMAHLRKHGDDYLAEGGRFRTPRPTDVALVNDSLGSE